MSLLPEAGSYGWNVYFILKLENFVIWYLNKLVWTWKFLCLITLMLTVKESYFLENVRVSSSIILFLVESYSLYVYRLLINYRPSAFNILNGNVTDSSVAIKCEQRCYNSPHWNPIQLCQLYSFYCCWFSRVVHDMFSSLANLCCKSIRWLRGVFLFKYKHVSLLA